MAAAVAVAAVAEAFAVVAAVVAVVAVAEDVGVAAAVAGERGES